MLMPAFPPRTGSQSKDRSSAQGLCKKQLSWFFMGKLKLINFNLKKTNNAWLLLHGRDSLLFQLLP